MLEIIAQELEAVNQAYIESDYGPDDYKEMVLQSLLQTLLGCCFDSDNAGAGLYEHPESVGFTGWITDGLQTLYFAPTKLVFLDNKKGPLTDQISGLA